VDSPPLEISLALQLACTTIIFNLQQPLPTHLFLLYSIYSNKINGRRIMTESEIAIQQPKNEVHRIHIGGVQPPNLTVKMVQKRLKTTLPEIEFLSFDESEAFTNPLGKGTQIFFYANIILKSDVPGSSSSSAVDMVAKMYNNVKWKGCTLRVKKARVHFLQRLEMERRDEKAAVEAKAKMLLEMQEKQRELDKLAEITPLVRKTKRHLRMRKQFGEEAYLVDTKPIVTNTQKDLHLSLKKQREKRKKHLDILIMSRRKKKNQDLDIEELKKTEKNLSLQSKPFLNRAIHIQFNEENMERLVHSSIIYSDDDDDDRQKGIVKKDFVGNSVSDDESSVPSSSDEESTDDALHDNQKRKLDKDEEYGWSDDGDDNATNPKPALVDKDTQKEVDHEKKETRTTKVIETIGQILDSPPVNDDASTEEEGNGYVWSDSDSDSDGSETNYEFKYFDYNESKHDDLDEFASEFKDNAFSSLKYGEITFADENDPDFEEDPFSLRDDVTANMHIMTKLFPELLGSKPEEFDEQGGKAKTEAPVGWDSSGLMQRYDPTAVTATTYEVKTKFEESVQENTIKDSSQSRDTEKEEEGSSSSQVSSESNTTDQDFSEEEDGSKVEEDKQIPTTQQIYEQKKLETIFQQDRTSKGTTGFQFSSLFDQSDVASKPQREIDSGSFSFGFMPNATAKSTIGAEMGVDVKPNEDSSTHERTLNKTSEETAGANSQDDFPKLKMRRGMAFSKSELEVYTTDFFNANEGIQAILDSLEDPKNAEVDQERWEEERKTLTLDWKRKQNQAVAQKKKRIKIR
jgi:hypothetical protein